MADCMLLKNGGGIKSDDLTVNSSKIISGYTYVGSDTDDDIGTGTLNSRLNATSSKIISGYTYVGSDTGSDIGTGSLNSRLNVTADKVLKGYTYVGSDSGTDIKTGTLEPQLVGTFTGNQSINVSGWKRSTDSVNNFIVEIISSNTFKNTFGIKYTYGISQFDGFSMSKSLSGTTLTVSGVSKSIYFGSYHDDWQTAYFPQESKYVSGVIEMLATYKVWHI